MRLYKTNVLLPSRAFLSYFFFLPAFLRHFSFGNLTPVVTFLPLAIFVFLMIKYVY